jgi:PAS domain S-box-containing protein
MSSERDRGSPDEMADADRVRTPSPWRSRRHHDAAMRAGPFARFWVLALIAAGALSMLTFVPLVAQNQLMRQDTHRRAELVSQLTAKFVQQELESIVELTASHAGPASAAAQGDDGPAYDGPEVEELLRGLYDVTPGMQDVLIADTRGLIRAIEPAARDDNPPGRLDVWQWHRELKQDEEPGRSAALLGGDGSGIVTAAVLLKQGPSDHDSPTQVIGVLAANYDVGKSLRRFVSDLDHRVNIDLTVIDDDGRIIAAPTGEPTSPLSPKNDPDLRSALAGKIAVNDVGGSVVSGYAPVEGTGWAVRADLSLRPFLAADARFRTLVFSAAGLLGLMLIIGFGRLAASLRAQSRAEEELRSSEQRTRAILEAASDAFVSIDRRGRVVDWNACATTLFGWSHEEAMGQPLEVIVAAPEDRTTCRERLQTYLTGQRPLWTGQRDLVAHHRVVGGFPVEVGAWLSGDPSCARDVTMNVFIRDITERVHRTQELAAKRDEAMQASRLKSEFLANMSHEIRTPLAGVIGMAQLLLETEMTPEQRSYTEAMADAGEHLLSVIGYILDLSKLEAGKLTLEATSFDPVGVLERVSRLLAVPAEQKGVHLEAVVDPDVPRQLYGDAGRLQQILMNLGGNAVKFTETGHIDLCLEAGSREGSTVTLRFTVVDTGIGIDPNDVDRLLEPFVQADTSTARTFGGTGLGLSIVRHLTDLFGGRLTVDSEPGSGSIFSVELPFETCGEHEELTPSSFSLSGLDASNGGAASGEVLVVEDNPLNQQLARAMLEKLGYAVTISDSGEQALHLLARRGYSAVIMDCQMPLLDGYATTKRLRVAEDDGRQRTPVIAMTANAMLEERQRCLDAGMDDYLVKPVRVSDLQRVLQRWIAEGSGREDTRRSASPVIPEPDGGMPDGGVLDDGVLDDSVLGELRSAVSPAVLSKLIATYDVSCHRLLDALHDAVAEADRTAVQRLAHEFRGVTASLGVTCAAATCEQLEDETTALEVLPNLIDRLAADLGGARLALEDALTGPGATAPQG